MGALSSALSSALFSDTVTNDVPEMTSPNDAADDAAGNDVFTSPNSVATDDEDTFMTPQSPVSVRSSVSKASPKSTKKTTLKRSEGKSSSPKLSGRQSTSPKRSGRKSASPKRSGRKVLKEVSTTTKKPRRKSNASQAFPSDPIEAFASYMETGDSPNEVLPGLWLGGFNAWYRGDTLARGERLEVENIPKDMFFSNNKISKVVSLGKHCPKTEDFAGILDEVAHLDIDDCAEDDAPAKALTKDFDGLVSQMIQWRMEGKNVYVHCRAGQSRSATVVLAYFVVVFKFSVAEAISQLYRMRSGPRGVIPSGLFLDALVSWERTDECQEARARFAEHPKHKQRLQKDIEFLSAGWEVPLSDDVLEFTHGMWSGIVRGSFPEFVFDPKKHVESLATLAGSLEDA